jgi:hypothetical protein
MRRNTYAGNTWWYRNVVHSLCFDDRRNGRFRKPETLSYLVVMLTSREGTLRSRVIQWWERTKYWRWASRQRTLAEIEQMPDGPEKDAELQRVRMMLGAVSANLGETLRRHS